MAFLSFENIFEMSAYISGTPYGYLRITSNSKIFLAVGPGAILSIINTPKYNCSPTITYFFHYSIAHKTLQQQQSRLSKRTSVKYLSVNKDSSILNTPIPFLGTIVTCTAFASITVSLQLSSQTPCS